jgi:hypothetical protein
VIGYKGLPGSYLVIRYCILLLVAVAGRPNAEKITSIPPSAGTFKPGISCNCPGIFLVLPFPAKTGTQEGMDKKGRWGSKNQGVLVNLINGLFM